MEIRKGYKQTEVGVIPGDWEISALGGIADIYRGASPRPIDSPVWFDKNSDIGWVRISDVTKSNKILYETTQRLSKLGVRHSRFVPKGNLIMSICATVGRPILTNIDVCIHDGFVVFENPQINGEFLYYILSFMEKDWSKHGQTGSQMNLNTGIINPSIIPLPPTKSEQTAIATALSDADALITSLEKLIAKKRAIKQGAMQELLTGKKRLEGFEKKKGYKQTEVGMIPEDWDSSKIPDVTDKDSGSIKIGPFGSQLKKDLLTKTGYKIYGQENVFQKNMSIGDRFINKEHFKKLQSCEICSGDFLISMMGTIGKCITVPNGIKKGIMDSHLLRLRFKENKLNSIFLENLFGSKIIVNQVKKLSVGGIMEGLSSKIIRNIYLPLPDIYEQIAISTVLSDMDAEIESLEKKLEKYHLIKQGMMQELLTGKTRLI